MKKTPTVAIVLTSALLSAAATSCTGGAETHQQTPAAVAEISPEAAHREMRSNPDVFVLDVRSREEYMKAHIAGSVLIPGYALGEHIVRNTIHPDINRGRTPRKDQSIICVCAWGIRSAHAARKLTEMGYTNVRNLAGGLTAWKQAGLPVVGAGQESAD